MLCGPDSEMYFSSVIYIKYSVPIWSMLYWPIIQKVHKNCLEENFLVT